MPIAGPGCKGGDGGGIEDVELTAVQLRAAFNLGQPSFVDVRGPDLCPQPVEGLHRRTSNTLRGSRDDDDLPLEIPLTSTSHCHVWCRAVRRTMNDAAIEGRPIPVDAEARSARWNCFAGLDPNGRRRHHVKLRDVFQPATIWHRAAQTEMDLHQEVRAYRHVEGFGHMRDLQPRRDAADAADIDLHDRAGARFR